jgi:hypothetical protein
MICQTIFLPCINYLRSGCLTQLFQAVKRNLRRSKAHPAFESAPDHPQKPFCSKTTAEVRRISLTSQTAFTIFPAPHDALFRPEPVYAAGTTDPRK